MAGERAGPGDVDVAVRVEQVAVLRAYLKIERGPSARLLALAGVGSAIAARWGDAQASPPWPPPKSTAAGPLSIFRQTLGEFPRFAGKEFAQGKEILRHIRLTLRKVLFGHGQQIHESEAEIVPLAGKIDGCELAGGGFGGFPANLPAGNWSFPPYLRDVVKIPPFSIRVIRVNRG